MPPVQVNPTRPPKETLFRENRAPSRQVHFHDGFEDDPLPQPSGTWGNAQIGSNVKASRTWGNDEVPRPPTVDQVYPSPPRSALGSTSASAAAATPGTEQQKATKPEAKQPGSVQPTSHPAIGSFPGSHPASSQWYSSSNQAAGRGFVGAGGHPAAGQNLFGPSPHSVDKAAPHFTPHPTQPHSYIGGALQEYNSMAADYQNTAAPRWGQCYQPPVPDTTFGPMYHTYTPRFDHPGGQGPPGFQHPPAVAPVPVAGQYGVPQQPGQIYVGQHMVSHPPMAYGQHPQMAQQFQPIPMAAGGGIMGPPPGGPLTMIPMMPGNSGPNVPEVAGIGRTPMEETVRQHHFAHSNKMFEPQDFKPADDDPSRFYYVREVDGNWTQRNRFTIDNTGDCRWFVTPEGWFYAVRQPD